MAQNRIEKPARIPWPTLAYCSASNTSSPKPFANATKPLANATKLLANVTNFTQPQNFTKLTNNPSAVLMKNNSGIAKNATMNRNSTSVFDARKRNEILSHFIPTIASTEADRLDSFQSGSRKHKLHHMYPSCYQCPKHSNYSECVKKATLLKCNEGLNNICFAKSLKHGKKEKITYEMGCTNHTHCRNAKAFPCRGKIFIVATKCCNILSQATF